MASNKSWKLNVFVFILTDMHSPCCYLCSQYTCLGKTSYNRYSKLFRATDLQIEDMIIDCSKEVCAQLLRQQQAQAQGGLLSGPLGSTSLAANGASTSSGAAGAGGGDGGANQDISGAVTGMDTSVEDPFANIAPASPSHGHDQDHHQQAEDNYIHSQDSNIGTESFSHPNFYDMEYSNWSMASTTNGHGSARLLTPLERGDIIIDKMHIHYGKKNQNPVDCMRFYPKGANERTYVAQQIDDKVYETLLPRSFEELAVRVFCRDPRKESIAAKAFKLFCNTENIAMPFPSQSQAELDVLDFEDDL